MDYSPRFAGAVPLDALARSSRASQPAGGDPTSRPRDAAGAASDAAPAASDPGATGGAQTVTVIDVTEATFEQDVLERSMTTPVVIDFWAEWCGPCKQLSPILERLAGEGRGAWVLAKIDVDANQRLAAAAAVQGIPAVKAVWQGGVVGEFTGAMPEAQVRPWIEELVRATGAVPPASGADAESEPPAVDPALAAAADAFERGDYDAAERGYQAILAERPADQLAAGALAGVRLYKRAEQLDAGATRAQAQAQPEDVAAQCAASDVDVLDGLTAEAFQRLVAVVARTSGADRDKARLHLLQLFDVVGHDDPQVVQARAALSRALF